jgi:hypothetical protein
MLALRLKVWENAGNAMNKMRMKKIERIIISLKIMRCKKFRPQRATEKIEVHRDSGGAILRFSFNLSGPLWPKYFPFRKNYFS